MAELLNAAAHLYLSDQLQAATSLLAQAVDTCTASALCQGLRFILRRLHSLEAYAAWARTALEPGALRPLPQAGAVAAWEAALGLDRELFGPQGTPMRARLRRRLAQGWAQLAEDALARGHLRKARIFLTQIQEVQPGSLRTAGLWDRLRERARDLYLEGYALEEFDPQLAAQRWREVVELGLTGEEAFVRARERLEALRRRMTETRQAGADVAPPTVPPGAAGLPPP